MLKKTGQLIDLFNENAGRFASYFLLLIIFVMLFHILSRYVFDRPTIWAWDISRFLFGSYVLLGAGYHILHRRVIVVDILYNRFPQKVKLIADLISFMAVLIFCLVVIWQGGESAWRSLQSREISTSVFGMPLYPLRMLIPVGAFLIMIQSGRQFFSSFAATFRKGVE